MARRLILLRHPPVATAWTGRCYGQSDMGLSRAGQAMIAPLVEAQRAVRPDMVLHSDLRRTRIVASAIARRLRIPMLAAPLWRERDFGAWEGERWDRIYRRTGNAMDGMITHPDSFRPGGTGETTQELIDRVAAAIDQVPAGARILIVSHGGPIAAARFLRQKRREIADLPALIIPTGTQIQLDL